MYAVFVSSSSSLHCHAVNCCDYTAELTADLAGPQCNQNAITGAAALCREFATGTVLFRILITWKRTHKSHF